MTLRTLTETMTPEQWEGATRARNLFVEQQQELYYKLRRALESGELSPLEYGELCADSTGVTSEIHNSDSHPQFYNSLTDFAVAALQVPTERKIPIGENLVDANVAAWAALNNAKTIHFAGFAPRHSTNAALNDMELEDVEPLFIVECQEDTLLPEPQKAFSFSVRRDLNMRLNLFNVQWVKVESFPSPEEIRRARRAVTLLEEIRKVSPSKAPDKKKPLLPAKKKVTPTKKKEAARKR